VKNSDLSRKKTPQVDNRENKNAFYSERNCFYRCISDFSSQHELNIHVAPCSRYLSRLTHELSSMQELDFCLAYDVWKIEWLSTPTFGNVALIFSKLSMLDGFIQNREKLKTVHNRAFYRFSPRPKVTDKVVLWLVIDLINLYLFI